MTLRIFSWNVNGIRSIWKKGFREWVQKESPDILCLQETKEQDKIVVCGDYNTAHKEIDLARPEKWCRFSGFLPIEREWLDQIINLGYVDVFREFNKEPGWYTYWDPKIMAREKNLGWRIDYFFVSKEASGMVTSARILKDVTGSDHCPVELEIK